MRDPDRIDPFLKTLGELWHKYPDYRFGQLVMNLLRDDELGWRDPWHWENDEWEERIENYDKAVT